MHQALQYLFGYEKVFPLKNLDLSFNVDLDFWDFYEVILERKTGILKPMNYYTAPIFRSIFQQIFVCFSTENQSFHL